MLLALKPQSRKKDGSSSTNGTDASVKKSFAPKGELSKQVDANNITVWDGFLEGDFSLRLHQYLNTSKYYIGLRGMKYHDTHARMNLNLYGVMLQRLQVIK